VNFGGNMKSPSLASLVVLFLITIIFISFPVAGGPGGDPGEEEGAFTVSNPGSPAHPDPVILSKHDQQMGIKLWTGPTDINSIVFDNWVIGLYGDVGDFYNMKINGIETFIGSLNKSYVQLSYDASALTIARITIQIGNRSYLFNNTIVQHNALTWEEEDINKKPGGYSKVDIDQATLKGAFGVLLMSFASIWFSHALMKSYHSKRGVREI
jgi:hypothetical protein